MWLMLAGAALLVLAGLIWAAFGRAPDLVRGPGMVVPEAGFIQVGQEATGVVDAVYVRAGDRLDRDARIARLRTSDGAVIVRSPAAGRVAAVLVAPGVVTPVGTSIVTLVPAGSPDVVVGFLPAGLAKRIRVGMTAQVAVESVPRSQYGMIVGTVTQVAEVPATDVGVRLRAGENTSLADYFLGTGPVLEVLVDLTRDPATPSGYKWTVGQGPPDQVTTGTLVAVGVVLGVSSPLDSLL